MKKLRAQALSTTIVLDTSKLKNVVIMAGEVEIFASVNLSLG